MAPSGECVEVFMNIPCTLMSGEVDCLHRGFPEVAGGALTGTSRRSPCLLAIASRHEYITEIVNNYFVYLPGISALPARNTELECGNEFTPMHLEDPK
jgi:hypothetical protein